MVFNSELYFITDSTPYDREDFLFRVEEALKGGVTLMQLREKNRTTREYIELAKAVHEISSRYKVPLIIDDRVDVMLAVDAEGVHLGAEDMELATARKIIGKDKILGATAKTVPVAMAAYEAGADYLGVGAIFPTTTKVKTIITSVDTLKDIVNTVPIPVNAIGGLNPSNMNVLKETHIAGVCAVSAIMKAGSPRKAAEEMLIKFKEIKG